MDKGNLKKDMLLKKESRKDSIKGSGGFRIKNRIPSALGK